MKYLDTKYFTVNNENGELICYSNDFSYVYSYLKNFYTINPEFIKLDITVIRPDENGVFREIQDKSEYLLTELCGDVVVTTWEYELWIDYFKGYYENIKDLLYKTAIKQLSKMGLPIYSDNINSYLRDSMGQKYYNILTFDSFIESLDKTEIIKIINGCPFSKDVYYLNKEYNRKFLDDK